MFRTIAISAVLLGSLGSAAWAQSVPGSGEYYLAACRGLAANAPLSSENVLASLTCAIDIDNLSGMGRFLPEDSRFCRPADISIPQMAGVAVGFIEAHADKQKDPFPSLAGAAFHAKWPCP